MTARCLLAAHQKPKGFLAEPAAAKAADPARGEDPKEAGQRGLLTRVENRILRPTSRFVAIQARRGGADSRVACSRRHWKLCYIIT
jgi:hypothetical protein